MGQRVEASAERRQPPRLLLGGHLVGGHGLHRRTRQHDPIDGEPHVVVGVAPAGFAFPIGSRPVDVWTTLSRGPDEYDVYLLNDRGGIYILGYPSVTLLQNAGDPDANPEPGPITDFCTPLTSHNVSFGVSKDNKLTTGVDETGYNVSVNPKAGTYTFTTVGVAGAFSFDDFDAAAEHGRSLRLCGQSDRRSGLKHGWRRSRRGFHGGRLFL